MIYERAARREFAQAAAATIVVLLAVVLSVQLIRLLKDAALGKLAPEGVLAMLTFAATRYMPMLLTLTVFIAVLLSLSRMYRDSEMVVWFASGMPLQRWIGPVIRFSLPILLVIAALSMVLSPWATQAQATYQATMSVRSELSMVTPGAFREIRDGQQVYFIENLDDQSGRIGTVFVASMLEGKLGVVMSERGHQETLAGGERFLVLEQGRRYEVEPGMPAFRVMDFERYAVRTEDGDTPQTRRAPGRIPFLELIKMDDPIMRSEVVYRIAVPVSALILVLMAIPLAYVNPRAGRSANLLIAIIIYAIYSNVMSIAQTWVMKGKLPFAVGMFLPHILMLLPLLLLFYVRQAGGLRWRRKVS